MYIHFCYCWAIFPRKLIQVSVVGGTPHNNNDVINLQSPERII